MYIYVIHISEIVKHVELGFSVIYNLLINHSLVSLFYLKKLKITNFGVSVIFRFDFVCSKPKS